MFTGFASENTPAIQVWDCYVTNTPVFNIGLADDCAPIQYIRTGSSTTSIEIYLPTCPIEGKIIKIVNAPYNDNRQYINIKIPDASGNGSNNVLSIGPGQYLEICYTKQVISPMNWGFNYTGISRTGWIPLNIASTTSINSYAFAVGFRASAIAARSAVIGGDANQALFSNSAVVGGSSNTASQTNAVIVGGSSNTASGINAAVVGGSSNTASNQNSVVIGGGTNAAGGDSSVIVGGLLNTANGQSSVVVGGQSNTVGGSGTNSVVVGGAWGTTRNISGNFVTPASSVPITAATGVNQLATLLIARQTTDATATRLTSNTSAAGTTNQVILPNNSAYTFQGTCIANVTGGGTTSGWKFEGVIKRGANAASTTLVAAVTPTVIAQDAGASTWVLAITADTTNGGIKVEVTGAAATTIRWVTKIETTEVTF
jgi:hypothetical protein